MQAYRIQPGAGIDSLERFEHEMPAPRGRDVLVRVHAVSLNYRDLMVARSYPHVSGKFVIPVSDGAGEVVAVGPDVTRFRVGDRVTGAFYPDWIAGEPGHETTARALGGTADGLLAQSILLTEEALVAIPESLDFIEASTLSCAGVTAWNALFETSALAPGSTVLLLGTGGVSIWALQLAKAAGMRVIITSSDDRKLERARALGADATINYRATPAWDDEVRRLTHGNGVDRVLEVGGAGTLERSILAARYGATIAVVGAVSGMESELNPFWLVRGAKHLAGVSVGSRAMLERLSRFVASRAIHPIVDRVFDFQQASEAYRYLESGRHLGKVVIALEDRSI